MGTEEKPGRPRHLGDRKQLPETRHKSGSQRGSKQTVARPHLGLQALLQLEPLLHLLRRQLSALSGLVGHVVIALAAAAAAQPLGLLLGLVGSKGGAASDGLQRCWVGTGVN